METEQGREGDPASSNSLSPGRSSLLQWLITGRFESEVAHEMLLSELRGQGSCKKVRETVIYMHCGAIRQLFMRRNSKQTKLGEAISDGHHSVGCKNQGRREDGKGEKYRHIKAAVKTTNRAALMMQSSSTHCH